jgi:sulfite reductase (NADPH) hemoprotein beta-component
MYRYDEFDDTLVRERARQFRGQVQRRLSGELKEEHFKPLRLQNGVYLQLHAYMLRVAIPYGQLNGRKLRQLAMIADKYDKGYGHFTTRQNIQFNWIKLADMPDVLDDLADVEMHAIQTSGNCIRNVTSDHLAGAWADEIEDPRPWCEIIRQWSTFHPEFTSLPRKFKIAVTAAAPDRAAVRVHDIGLHMKRNAAGLVGFEFIVGGGLGRTPYVGHTIRDWIAKEDLLSYLEANMRVYNRYGRRDNKYKARIKILVNELGVEEYRSQVEEEFAAQHAFEVEHHAARQHRRRTAVAEVTAGRYGIDRNFVGVGDAHHGLHFLGRLRRDGGRRDLLFLFTPQRRVGVAVQVEVGVFDVDPFRADGLLELGDRTGEFGFG